MTRIISFTRDNVFDGLDIPVFIVGLDGRINDVNASARALDPSADFSREPRLHFESWLSGWAEEGRMTPVEQRGFRHLCGPDRVYKLLRTPIRDQEGQEIGAFIELADCTGEHDQLRQIEEAARIDALTGFYNRMEYDRLLSHQSGITSPLGVMMIDVNGLKAVNDRFGHRAGDTLIRTVAAIIRQVMPENASLYRIGGDEFVAVLPGVDKKQLKALIPQLLAAAKSPCVGDPVSLAVGCIAREEKAMTIDQMVCQADQRMYKMKREYYADERNNRRKLDD